SADIRMVVDALDLCYTKSHVDTFVIISGDSDFSPLVSKLRENNKTVIGAGVKKSTSDLFISNCDEFLYYDDLVRAEPARKRTGMAARSDAPEDSASNQEASADGPSSDRALDLLIRTLEALRTERGDDYPIRGSLVKEAIKRQNPGFNERAHGFRAFNDLLLEAQKRRLVKLESDKQAGSYIVRLPETASRRSSGTRSARVAPVA
ncbi:MAG: NYN domain-containing protein, partial [Verrucomicrobiota bacterium]|nr:NYN domain-containing protein [Verrucomicrobiota bacterium]